MSTKRPNFFMNLVTSGKPFDVSNPADVDERIRYILLNSMIFLGSAFLFLFAIQSFQIGSFIQGAVDAFMGCIVVLAFFLLRTALPFSLSAYMAVIPYGILCGFLAFSGGVQGSGVLWVYTFPLIAIFLFGMRTGLILSGILGAFFGVCVFVPGFAAVAFEPSFAGRAVGVYVVILVLTLVYEQTKVSKDKHLAKLNAVLKAERDEIAVMKDNLKDGVFLLDADYVVQPNYSPSMETIFGESSLADRSFLDLLKNSLSQKNLDTLTDYFEMVINRSYDAEMLADINPLYELRYTGSDAADERVLSCSFAPVEREDGRTHILGTVKDQTRETQLAEQLSEEENKRRDEMQSLFEVIHVDPQVFHDFIEDTEYELEKINDCLKDREKNTHTAITEMYQSVHAMKSNAVILGLTNFSTKLHGIEQEISVLRDRETILFNEILHITMQIEKIFRAQDTFKELLEKIRSFKSGESRLQERHVLTKTLEKIIEKISESLGKSAALEIVELDTSVLTGSSRRIVKEVLVQLVRNAMYHGIEPPEIRRERGKPESGLLRLSISRSGGRALIQLSDDGSGIDYAKIRRKAEEMGLIAEPSVPYGRNDLLKILFSPGFSTAEGADMHAGRGIGLNLVADRIRSMKGNIRVSQEDGQGTLFKITLPMEAESVAEAS